MWVEELTLNNIKCFDGMTIRFAKGETPSNWVTFLSENGGGKSTALQALALLLAGPESIPNLQPRPFAWLRAEKKAGVISTRIHQGENDPVQWGDKKIRKVFGYSYHVTGSQPITVRNRLYSEPTIVGSAEKNLSWLRNTFVNSDAWTSTPLGGYSSECASNQPLYAAISRSEAFWDGGWIKPSRQICSIRHSQRMGSGFSGSIFSIADA
jgi:hypothetical protein